MIPFIDLATQQARIRDKIEACFCIFVRVAANAIPVQIRLGKRGSEGKTASEKHDIIVFNLERTSRFDFWVCRATYHGSLCVFSSFLDCSFWQGAR